MQNFKPLESPSLGVLPGLTRAGRTLFSVVQDCAVAVRLGEGWADKRRLASALVGWHHAGRIPFLTGEVTTDVPLRLRAFGRRFNLWLAPDAMKNEMLVFFEIFGQHVYDVPLAFDPSVIVDLGSFIGLSPLFFTLRYPSAAVYCVEPDPGNFAALCRNTAPFPAVRRLDCAVAGQRGQRQLYLSDTQSCGHSLYPGEVRGRSVRVACVTVNDLIDRFDLPGIDILKFDVEGAEREIFSDFPFRVPVNSLVGELHLSPADEAAFARKFSDRGYQVTLSRDEFLGLTMFRAVLSDHQAPKAGAATVQ